MAVVAGCRIGMPVFYGTCVCGWCARIEGDRGKRREVELRLAGPWSVRLSEQEVKKFLKLDFNSWGGN